VSIIQSTARKFYKIVGDGIDPAFDSFERIQKKHPKTIFPINLALCVMFPGWCIMSVITQSLMKEP
jgi:hypothetical protein